jgi:type III secretion system FlhB-like substrate exporter
MFFVRKLYNLHVDNTIVELFYRSVVESIITFGIAAWYGNCTQASKSKLCKIIKNAKRLGVQNAKSLVELYEKFTMQKATAIRSDCEHPLYNCYEMLRSGRRLQAAYTRTVRFNKSFVPASIKLLNNV